MHNHSELYEKLKPKYPNLNQQELLRVSLKNYRTGKGLNLEYDAFKYLNDNKAYDFTKFPKPPYLSSRDLVILDQFSTMPYFMDKNDIWVSEYCHITTLSLVSSFYDFLNLIK